MNFCLNVPLLNTFGGNENFLSLQVGGQESRKVETGKNNVLLLKVDEGS